MRETLLRVTPLSRKEFVAALHGSLRLCASFVAHFSAIFVALELAIKIASECKLAAICRRDMAEVSIDATWRRFGGNCSKYCTGIAAKSLLVYTCDKSCIRERDKHCTKNRMCKRAFTQLAFPMSLLVVYF